MVTWRSDGLVEGMRQRIFSVPLEGRDVPAVVWTAPDAASPRPLVLIGHGGGGHKTDESRLDLAHRYLEAGLVAAAIDGPWHGERAPREGEARERYDDASVDRMVEDWRATLDVLVALPELDAARVGYGGVSMGTMFGLPFVAAEPRIRAAVLGLCGLREASGEPVSVAARLALDAARITAPLLYLVQWDDDIFERAGVLELFDALATRDKQLLANTGLHHQTPQHAREATTAFLVTRLLEA